MARTRTKRSRARGEPSRGPASAARACNLRRRAVARRARNSAHGATCRLDLLPGRRPALVLHARLAPRPRSTHTDAGRLRLVSDDLAHRARRRAESCLCASRDRVVERACAAPRRARVSLRDRCTYRWAPVWLLGARPLGRSAVHRDPVHQSGLPPAVYGSHAAAVVWAYRDVGLRDHGGDARLRLFSRQDVVQRASAVARRCRGRRSRRGGYRDQAGDIDLPRRPAARVRVQPTLRNCRSDVCWDRSGDRHASRMEATRPGTPAAVLVEHAASHRESCSGCAVGRAQLRQVLAPSQLAALPEQS